MNYYNDHFEKLREKDIKYIERNELLDKQFGSDIKLHKIEETKIIKEEDNGWDLKKDIDSNIFNIVKVERVFEHTRIDIFIRKMSRLYEENNCLDLFIKYYGNYLVPTMLSKKVLLILL